MKKKLIFPVLIAASLTSPTPALACRIAPTDEQYEERNRRLRQLPHVQGIITFLESDQHVEGEDRLEGNYRVPASITDADGEITQVYVGPLVVDCGPRSQLPFDGAEGFFYIENDGRIAHWSTEPLRDPLVPEVDLPDMPIPSVVSETETAESEQLRTEPSL